MITQTAVGAPRSVDAKPSAIRSLWTKVEESNITIASTTVRTSTDFEVLPHLDASCKVAKTHSDVVFANTEQAE